MKNKDFYERKILRNSFAQKVKFKIKFDVERRNERIQLDQTVHFRPFDIFSRSNASDQIVKSNKIKFTKILCRWFIFLFEIRYELISNAVRRNEKNVRLENFLLDVQSIAQEDLSPINIPVLNSIHRLQRFVYAEVFFSTSKLWSNLPLQVQFDDCKNETPLLWMLRVLSEMIQIGDLIIVERFIGSETFLVRISFWGKWRPTTWTMMKMVKFLFSPLSLSLSQSVHKWKF